LAGGSAPQADIRRPSANTGSWSSRPGGINMTGMPSFQLAGAKDKDIGSITAFLKRLPSVSEGDYKAWTAPQAPASPPAPGSNPSPPA
jgi:hypothetical protein